MPFFSISVFECYGSLRKNYALESLGGVASQSCAYGSLLPSKGIDGIIDNTSSGNFEGAHTCHSDTEVEKSWEVELAVRTNVDSVTIYNRNDDRMEPVILQLYDGSELVASKPLSGIWQNSDVSADGTAENDVFTVPIGNVVATKVKLYRAPGDNVPINFHELQVWGTSTVPMVRSVFLFIEFYLVYFSQFLCLNATAPSERTMHSRALVA